MHMVVEDMCTALKSPMTHEFIPNQWHIVQHKALFYIAQHTIAVPRN